MNTLGNYESAVRVIVISLEGLGVATMIIGFLIAGVFSIRALVQGRSGRTAFLVLRRLVGSSILLGLEILVAAEVIRTIMTPSLEEAATLGLIVAIRTVLSISIQIEIDGILPWKRALLANGGQMLAESVAREAKTRETSASGDR
ncbi:DUF1622 domain-containing protein [Nesterenkonia muleiensis]|uniref:DUF1622 domain-containing protein n=1 Tax=Nesterenkonia muleiensis TaxID=2282648 RepID=UPI000E72B8C5|nr:DUF1622 domain-containing protein [Nesterenkonia muleiensis]